MIQLEPIGFFQTDETQIPRHWSVSEVKGRLVIDKKYQHGLKDIQVGQRIVVLFHFHRSAPFQPALLEQTPPHRQQARGVFSICSPQRPNPLGFSLLEVLEVQDNILTVLHADMFDGTPILDIKPHIEGP